MSPVLLTGVITITLALVAYTLGIAGLLRRRAISGRILTFLTVGLVLDVVATACMTLLAGGFELTLHGVVGYLALGLMLVQVACAWRHYRRFAGDPVPEWLLRYTRTAYVLWFLAFVTGVALGVS